eukprot:m.210097 g.210097  ORF g.210097 m.210097 type:complete len:61 (+) comp39742_c1_seq5:102-284(+)
MILHKCSFLTYVMILSQPMLAKKNSGKKFTKNMTRWNTPTQRISRSNTLKKTINNSTFQG